MSSDVLEVLIDQWVLIEQNKEKEYFLKALKNYRERKETRWATWNAERAKISHQVNKFSEKIESKSKLLKMKQKKEMKQMKATSL